MTVVIRNMFEMGWISRIATPRIVAPFSEINTCRTQKKSKRFFLTNIDSIVEALSILEDGEKEDLIQILKKI